MILERILEHKKAELRRKQSRGYLTELKNRIADGRPPMGFIKALESGRRADSPALIAEVKKASPSQGLMRSEFAEKFDPLKLARIYENHGASALSVLTDQEFFQGSLDYLAAIKDQVGLPALNKEFMVEEVQFYEARAYGADCVLLIVAALDRIQLQDLYAIAEGLDLNVLIETHDEQEVDTVLERIPDVQLLGINNRDLKTFSTDLSVTQRLAKRIPSDKFIVSESGIHKRDDVLRIHESGAKAMLIGESLIKADDISSKIKELLGQSEENDQEESKKETRWV
ncbi:MAG: indole-3-glycerol phosphate synthase TrpC [Nitrospirota bacterium]|nr:MAG: indole-3-glycerol phosphate synthase TrpC [Nitrospirota bacterium]